MYLSAEITLLHQAYTSLMQYSSAVRFYWCLWRTMEQYVMHSYKGVFWYSSFMNLIKKIFLEFPKIFEIAFLNFKGWLNPAVSESCKILVSFHYFTTFAAVYLHSKNHEHIFCGRSKVIVQASFQTNLGCCLTQDFYLKFGKFCYFYNLHYYKLLSQQKSCIYLVR